MKPTACEFCNSSAYLSGVIQGVECVEFRCGTEWSADGGFEQDVECQVAVLHSLLAEAHEAFQNFAITAKDWDDRGTLKYAEEWVKRTERYEPFYPKK